MDKTGKYLVKHFSELFGSLFFILFFITSIVFFIKITALTSVIKMNFIELGTLYLYLLPKTVVYTLPFTFFIALSITLYNLSKENETVVLFTLGYNPKKIAKLFLALSSFLSFLLIVDVLVLIPISKQLNTNFIEYKKSEAKFNIKASEFGQKLSNWLVYIDSSHDDKDFKGIALYQEKNEKENEKFILANTANIEKEVGYLKLKMTNGKAFEFDKNGEVKQIDFRQMDINTKSKASLEPMQSLKEYWSDVFTNESKAYDFSFFMLISLFPVCTTLIAISIGIVTYRYEKNGVYFFIFCTVSAYFALAVLLSKLHPQSSFVILSIVSFFISHQIYKKRIESRY
ncbi:MAG: LptF/LptG family permease [Sulfurospirillaceae bacterium]|nr:LptF/LptG family permease [Sulfurospirillaceae bacterium]MDD3462857.1 LptF/LptG family permease [Sulfurospirillaceae bacterium]